MGRLDLMRKEKEITSSINFNCTICTKKVSEEELVCAECVYVMRLAIKDYPSTDWAIDTCKDGCYKTMYASSAWYKHSKKKDCDFCGIGHVTILPSSSNIIKKIILNDKRILNE